MLSFKGVKLINSNAYLPDDPLLILYLKSLLIKP